MTESQAKERSDYILKALENSLPNVSDLVELSYTGTSTGSTLYADMISGIQSKLSSLPVKFLSSEKILFIDNKGNVVYSPHDINNYVNYINGDIEKDHRLGVSFVSAFSRLNPVTSTTSTTEVTQASVRIIGTGFYGYYVLTRIGPKSEPKGYFAYSRKYLVK